MVENRRSGQGWNVDYFSQEPGGGGSSAWAAANFGEEVVASGSNRPRVQGSSEFGVPYCNIDHDIDIEVAMMKSRARWYDVSGNAEISGEISGRSIMSFTGPLARAARALAQWPRGHVARLAGIAETMLANFENGGLSLDEEAQLRLRQTLEDGGVVFLPEDGRGGAGVRLKFTAQDVKQINRLEGEGGPVGTDDV